MQRMDMGPNGIYLIFGQNGVQRGGMYIPSPDKQMPPSWTPYAFVADADKAQALAGSLGSTSLFGPMDVPGGSRVAGLLDPAGAVFAIHSMPAAAAAPAAEPKPKAKAKAKPKAKAAAKPAASKKVVKKAAPKKKAAKKAAPKKKAPARKAKAKAKSKAKAKKKSGARRKK
jgi:predicted enzyme related to lactoylglutathione lyase